MRVFTTREQTDKLVELGFEPPKSISGFKTKRPYNVDNMVVFDDTQYPIYAYSIGELITMLPEGASRGRLYMELHSLWNVGYSNTVLHSSESELIDALFSFILQLKEIGYYDLKR